MKNNTHTKKIILMTFAGLIMLAFFGSITFWNKAKPSAPSAKPEAFSDYEVNVSDVSLQIMPSGIMSGPMYFDVITNLDAGKKLMFNLQDDDGFLYHEEIIVQENGFAQTGPITDGGNHLKGNYLVVITEPENDNVIYGSDEFKFS